MHQWVGDSVTFCTSVVKGFDGQAPITKFIFLHFASDTVKFYCLWMYPRVSGCLPHGFNLSYIYNSAEKEEQVNC